MYHRCSCSYPAHLFGTLRLVWSDYRQVLGGVEGAEARVFDQHQKSSDLKLCESWSVCGVCLANLSWLRVTVCMGAPLCPFFLFLFLFLLSNQKFTSHAPLAWGGGALRAGKTTPAFSSSLQLQLSPSSFDRVVTVPPNLVAHRGERRSRRVSCDSSS